MAIEIGIQVDGRKTDGAEGLPGKPEHAFFFGGFRTTYPSLRGIQGVFDDYLGVGNGTTFNSAFMAERPSPDRYRKMAAQVKEKLSEGPVTIVGHSYGCAEAMRALCADPEILNNPENIAKIRMIFISPVYNEGLIDGIKNISKFVRVMVQEARGVGVVFPGKSSITSGIVSASTMPSDAVPYAALRDAALIASPKLNNHVANAIDFVPERNYFALLDSNQDFQNRIRETDRQIVEAAEKHKKRKVRKGFRRRGKITKSIVSSIFDGKYADHFGDPQSEQLPSGTRLQAWKMKGKLVFQSIRGKEHAMEEKVEGAGIKIWEVIPQQDLMNSSRGRRRPVVTTSFTTHGSPWGSQSGILAALMEYCQ